MATTATGSVREAGAHSLYRIPGPDTGADVVFAAWASDCGVRLSVTVDVPGTPPVGGLVSLRDVRRLQRAVAAPGSRAQLALAPGGPATGGTAGVVETAAGEVRVVVTGDGRTYRSAPVRRELLLTVCRGLVDWHRLMEDGRG